MQIIDIEPNILLGFIGGELFNKRIREIVLRCETKREFNRTMEREVLPAVRDLFDDRVAHDVLRAGREVYGKRGEMR